MAPSSSLAQDTCLSRMQHGFESRRGHKLIRSPSALVHILSPRLMRPARTTGGSGASRREDTSPCCRAFCAAVGDRPTIHARAVGACYKSASVSPAARTMLFCVPAPTSSCHGREPGRSQRRPACHRSGASLVGPRTSRGAPVGASSRRRRGASRAGSRGVPRGRAGDEVLADLLPYPLVEIRQRLRHHPSLTEEFRRP